MLPWKKNCKPNLEVTFILMNVCKFVYLWMELPFSLRNVEFLDQNISQMHLSLHKSSGIFKYSG